MKLKYIIISVLALAGISGCDSYLDKQPDAQLTIETVFENRIRLLFDTSDYKCLTLSSADLTAISQEAPSYDLSDEAAYLLERALGVKKRRFPTTKAGSSSPRGRGTCARSAMMSCSWPMWAPTGQLPGSGHRLRNPENLCPGKRE